MKPTDIKKIHRIAITLNPSRIIISVSAISKKGTLYSNYNADGLANSKTAMQLVKLINRKNSRFTKESETALIHKESNQKHFKTIYVAKP